MPLEIDEMKDLEIVAIEAARRAGKMISAAAGETREVMNKEGGDTLASQVVTEVDLAADRMIRESLADSITRFGLGLLTEETTDDSSRFRSDYFWCIDPLDGTLPFVRGEPGYSVSIALVSKEGVSEIGVVFDPVTGTLYNALRGEGARRNGEPWSARFGDGWKESAGGRPLTLAIDPSFREDPSLMDQIDAMAGRLGCRGVVLLEPAGAVLNACRVAENGPAAYFKFPKPQNGGGSLWDFAAGACLLGELGMPVTDFQGAPLKLNRRETTFMNRDGAVIASDEEVAAAVRSFEPPVL